MKKSLLFILALVISCSFFLLYREYTIINQRYNDLLVKYNTISENINLLKTKLNNCSIYSEYLKKENNLLNNEILKLKKNYNNLLQQYQILNSKLREYEVKLNLKDERTSWIKDNFNYDFSNMVFIRTIEEHCILQIINLPCIIDILKEKYGFRYIKEEKDYLKSISEFIKDGGGDCEDWALFIASLIKYFMNNSNIGYITTCKKIEGEEMLLYKEDDIIYYLKNCKEFKINLKEYNKINILCYYENKSFGHCILGLTKVYLDPYNINKSFVYLIEPQTGEYLGSLEDLNKEIYLIVNDLDFYYKKWQWWK